MSTAGRYRIQAVAAMTGVSAPTLRAWERRYHIPRPSRTAAAYRLYTEADVAQVRRMRELCAGGHSAAQAAQIVSQTTHEEIDLRRQDPYEAMRGGLLQAAERYDAQAMQHQIAQALTVGPAACVYEKIFGPVLREAGLRWACGQLSITQEHLLSGAIETTLRNLLQLVQPVDAQRTIVLCCFGFDQHQLGLYGIGLRFAGWGFRVIVLGRNMPPQALADATGALRPEVVGLSCVCEPSSDAADLVAAYAKACGDALWFVGGASAARLEAAVTAHGGLLAPSDAEHLRRLLVRARRAPNRLGSAG